MSLGSEPGTCSIVDSTVQYGSANQYRRARARDATRTYVRAPARRWAGTRNEAREAKEAREQVAGWTNTDTRG